MNIRNRFPFGRSVLLIAAMTTISTSAEGESSSNFTESRTDYAPLLSCIDEIQGVLEGVNYDQPSRTVDCGRAVQYCQKISGHFISAISESNIVMRGCDSIQIEGQFDGIPCQKEGCYEEMIDLEMYNICCCSASMCNSTPYQQNTLLITFFLSLWLITL
ncbi:hypothetical protein GCK32_007958 [Trichostrongylus colubriformis]|uniref:Uncharacterized protein n=1 Tax=Trichostrongylus colubriformis TaxID=6319 RepID=A0AAN8GA86_TRICO